MSFLTMLLSWLILLFWALGVDAFVLKVRAFCSLLRFCGRCDGVVSTCRRTKVSILSLPMLGKHRRSLMVTASRITGLLLKTLHSCRLIMVQFKQSGLLEYRIENS